MSNAILTKSVAGNFTYIHINNDDESLKAYIYLIFL